MGFYLPEMVRFPYHVLRPKDQRIDEGTLQSHFPGPKNHTMSSANYSVNQAKEIAQQSIYPVAMCAVAMRHLHF